MPCAWAGMSRSSGRGWAGHVSSAVENDGARSAGSVTRKWQTIRVSVIRSFSVFGSYIFLLIFTFGSSEKNQLPLNIAKPLVS